MRKQKNRGKQEREKRPRSRLLIIAAVILMCVLGVRILTQTGASGSVKRQIAEKEIAAAELLRENARCEDELRQIEEGHDMRSIIERIAHELGLIYPGERVFILGDGH